MLPDACGGLRGPRWRAELAERWLARCPRSSAADADARALLVFHRRARRHGFAAAAEAFPPLAAALQCDSAHGIARHLQLLTLARATLPEITQRTAIDGEVVAVWQRTFFDVEQHLDAAAWLATHVLEPAERADPLFGCKLRAVLHGGLAAADELLAIETRLPLNTAEAERHHELRRALQQECAALRLLHANEDPIVILQLEERRMAAAARERRETRRAAEREAAAQDKRQREQARLDQQREQALSQQRREQSRLDAERQREALGARRRQRGVPASVIPLLKRWPSIRPVGQATPVADPPLAAARAVDPSPSDFRHIESLPA